MKFIDYYKLIGLSVYVASFIIICWTFWLMHVSNDWVMVGEPNLYIRYLEIFILIFFMPCIYIIADEYVEMLVMKELLK